MCGGLHRGRLAWIHVRGENPGGLFNRPVCEDCIRGASAELKLRAAQMLGRSAKIQSPPLHADELIGGQRVVRRGRCLPCGV